LDLKFNGVAVASLLRRHFFL